MNNGIAVMPTTEERAFMTLCRIPPDVFLSMAAREFRMGSALTCICGWAIREHLTYLGAHDPNFHAVPPGTMRAWTAGQCQSLFGGDDEEWDAIYWGVTDLRRPAIESAFVARLDRAVMEGR